MDTTETSKLQEEAAKKLHALMKVPRNRAIIGEFLQHCRAIEVRPEHCFVLLASSHEADDDAK